MRRDRFSYTRMSINNGVKFIRYSVGTILALHGLAKLLGGAATLTYVGGMPPFAPHDNPTAQLLLGSLAATAELLGGLGVATGILYRYACGLAIVVLAAAFSANLVQVTDFGSLMLHTWPLELALVVVGLLIAGWDCKCGCHCGCKKDGEAETKA
jgi:putative oxidoreductase